MHSGSEAGLTGTPVTGRIEGQLRVHLGL
jgi:hypothetical protein